MPEEPDCVRTHFLVRDTGIGMSKAYQKVIFESFSREDNSRVRKTEGSGLGMAITKYIVDAMGGSISVRSEQGEGSEFHVALDLVKAEEAPGGPVPPGWTVLVVDGDQRSCASTAQVLRSMGVQAEWCLDAGQARAQVQERQQRGEGYQMVLLHRTLPDMDGVEAARAIRADWGEASPLLLLTACDWSEVEAQAREAGVSGFLSRPLFPSTLRDALSAFAGTTHEAAASTGDEVDRMLRGKHILLAEDNELNWEVAQELLSVLELDLERVENGALCVERFQASPVGYYDAILMDVRMPIMDGYEATMAIRGLERRDASLPIIAMTADAFSEDIQKCLDCGMDDHLAKPIDIQNVANKLKKYLK